MEKFGPNPDLLTQRATECLTLGRTEEAAKNLRHAVKLGGEDFFLLSELAGVEFQLGRHRSALQICQRALASNPDIARPHRANLLSVAARSHARLGDMKQASATWNEAIQLNPHDVEFYLQRSDAERQLGSHDSRILHLEKGIDVTGAAAIRIEWVDALIDAGQLGRAMPEVEKKLDSNRWKASWLIRRARIRQAAGNADAASADLKLALEEIDYRINPKRPDPLLIAERTQALSLLSALGVKTPPS